MVKFDMIDSAFWTGKKVLLTGHTGFKGSWLSLWLTELGATVFGYALQPDTPTNLYTEASVNTLVNSLIADIRDSSQLNAYVEDVKPDIIFHLAAQPIVRDSFKDPVTTIDTNVMGTVNLLEAARKIHSVQAIVVVTSDKCYDNKEWAWGYRENEALGGHDPYSASKACAELITQCYRLSFMGDTGTDSNQCAVASARAGNVIGGGDWSTDRLIPDIISSVENNEDVALRNPTAIRPWQHVLEPLAGYLILAQKLATEGQQYAQAWNFGPQDSDARSVSWITEQLINLFESSSQWRLDSIEHPHEAQHLKLDCSKAQNELNWKPTWSLSECLREIVIWHQSHSAGEDMRSVSLETIKRYSQELAN